MKRLPIEWENILKQEDLLTDVKIYMSYKAYEDGYDPSEDNVTIKYLNPIVIKAFVMDAREASFIWRGLGKVEMGAKEIICDEQYKNYFVNCRKIEIDGEVYSVYQEALGNKAMIKTFPFKIIRVTVFKE